jgi:hypothetical protein
MQQRFGGLISRTGFTAPDLEEDHLKSLLQRLRG